MIDNEICAQPCGCDPGVPWVCQEHRTKNATRGLKPEFINTRALLQQELERPTNPKVPVMPPQSPQFRVKDSGERLTFSSGSIRDTSTGKIKWSRITFGPMMRRWAQHLTTAEAKYPDVAPGVPNFTLIESDEEYQRYKESAFRHFMSWFNDEVDEDHASACFFNINGVEIIKDKNRQGDK